MTTPAPTETTCVRPAHSIRLVPRLAALAILAAGLVSSTPARATPPDPGSVLSPCQVEGLEGQALCATVDVPENPALPDGRQIGLNVMVLPATGEHPAPEPLVIFFGGPGEGVVDAAPFIAQEYAEVREVRDILLVDIRGTGGSNPLRCAYQDVHTLLDQFMPFDGVVRCVDELSKTADLTRYTTPYVVDDVDHVRALLGYDKVVLQGGSYGTRAVQVYIRRHPEHVLAAELHGTVPMNDRMPETFARDAQRALDGVIDDCAIDDACRQAFPHLRAELWQVMRHYEDGHTIPATLADPKTGNERQVELSHASFVHGLRYMLYRSASAAQIPLAIHQAAAGDASVVAQVADAYDRGLSAGISEGLYLALTCTEDVPWIEPEDAIESAAGTFVGELRYRIQTAACSVVPRGELPEGYFEPVRSDVPVLMLTGELDPVTPPYQADRVAKTLPNSLHLVVPYGGHGFDGLEGLDCIETIEHRFLATGSLDGLDTGCVADVHRAGFALEGAAPEIELSAAELSRFAGSYRGEGGLSLTVTLEDGVLKVQVPGQGTFRLVPVAETRFRIAGAPPGYALVFTLDGDRVTEAQIEQGPGTTVALTRSEE